MLAERARQTSLHVDGTELVIRPVDIGDVDRLARMTERLSPKSRYFRFFASIRRLPWSALMWLADVDHCRRDALVALDGDEIVAVARYQQVGRGDGAETTEAELAVTVEDAWQHRGLGRQLAHRVTALARDRGFDRLRVTVLSDNPVGLDLLRRLAPDATVQITDGTHQARLPLRPVKAGR